MFVSAFAAIVMFAAPEAAQSGETASAGEAKPAAEAKAPAKKCYRATPSGSRMPRTVCVTQAPKAEAKDDAEPKAEAKAE